MNSRHLAMGFVCTLLTAGSAAATEASTGTYNELAYVLTASVSGKGACNDAVGSYYTATFYYPGPAKNGAIEWRPISTSKLFLTEEASFPTTPAVGVTTWSGTFKVVFQPGSTDASGTFNSTLVYTDKHTIMTTSTLVYENAEGGTCTTNLQLNYILNGK